MIPGSLHFTTAQLDEIIAALQRLRTEASAECVILADITGQLIESLGNLEGVNTAVLSALAAGEVAATREMARLVGKEARFKLMLHEGDDQSVYLSDVGGELVLVAILGNHVPIGMVRLLTRMTVDRLQQIIQASMQAAAAPESDMLQLLNADFERAMTRALDNTLPTTPPTHPASSTSRKEPR